MLQGFITKADRGSGGGISPTEDADQVWIPDIIASALATLSLDDRISVCLSVSLCLSFSLCISPLLSLSHQHYSAKSTHILLSSFSFFLGMKMSDIELFEFHDLQKICITVTRVFYTYTSLSNLIQTGIGQFFQIMWISLHYVPNELNVCWTFESSLKNYTFVTTAAYS